MCLSPLPSGRLRRPSMHGPWPVPTSAAHIHSVQARRAGRAHRSYHYVAHQSADGLEAGPHLLPGAARVELDDRHAARSQPLESRLALLAVDGDAPHSRLPARPEKVRAKLQRRGLGGGAAALRVSSARPSVCARRRIRSSIFSSSQTKCSACGTSPGRVPHMRCTCPPRCRCRRQLRPAALRLEVDRIVARAREAVEQQPPPA